MNNVYHKLIFWLHQGYNIITDSMYSLRQPFPEIADKYSVFSSQPSLCSAASARIYLRYLSI